MAKSKSKSQPTKQPRKAKVSVPTLVLAAPTAIPLDKLVLSDSNVRDIVDLDGIRALADSIQRRGLLQSLSVRPVVEDGAETGTYEIQCGGRRYRALLQLVGKGILEISAPVPCIIKTDGVAADDSLAENSDREDLHPIDEFNAFAAMKKDGMGDDDIAAAYKVTPALVRQRLRLASASPRLLQAYRDEEIDLQDLMAFCLVDDHGRQDRVFKELTDSSSLYPHSIKNKLTETTNQTQDKRARFVGLEAYEAAGGPVLRDLFSERDDGYLQDPDLLARMVTEKLAALRDNHLAMGWGAVIVGEELNYNEKKPYSRLTPLLVELTAEEETRIAALEAEADALAEIEERTEEQDARYDTLETELEGFRDMPNQYSAEDMAKGVVFITIGYDGSPSIDPGYCMPVDAQPPLANGETAIADGGDDDATGVGKPLPERLVQDLTSYRTAALRNALSCDFNVAFVAVLHALCLKQFYGSAYDVRSCLQISAQTSYPSAVQGSEDWRATREFNERDAIWKTKLPKAHAGLWEALMTMDTSLRNELFAHCSAATLNAVREQHNQRRSEIQHANQLQMALGVHMVGAGWSTTADNFFGRVTKEHIIAAVREAKDEKHADLIAHLKKPEMAKEAERLLQGTGWLPVPLRLDASPVLPDEIPDFLDEDNSDAEDACA